MFPNIGDDVWADAVVDETFHLRLFSSETGLGPGAAVFDMKTYKWPSNRKWDDSMEDGQSRAERVARSMYEYVGLWEPFPPLVWKRTGERYLPALTSHISPWILFWALRFVKPLGTLLWIAATWMFLRKLPLK